MTDEEYKRESEAFKEHDKEFGNDTDKEERHGFVAMGDDYREFIGASSGLAYKQGDIYSAYFYLSDLLVEKDFRNGL